MMTNRRRRRRRTKPRTVLTGPMRRRRDRAAKVLCRRSGRRGRDRAGIRDGPRGQQPRRRARSTISQAERSAPYTSTIAEFRDKWADPKQRAEIAPCSRIGGSASKSSRRVTNRPEADPFDLLCHFAYNAPLRTRRERAERLRAEKQDFFDQYGPEARAILNELLDKYAEHGTAQFGLPEALEVPPISSTGTSWRSRSSSGEPIG